MRSLGLLTALRPAAARLSWLPRSCYNTQPKISDPLRILFCGSDEFSCASLQTLQDEHRRNKELIRSIDVVVRPPKPTGRGNKVLREVPLQKLAQKLGLPVHERDTFTGWSMPQPEGEPINLIIAVSFGLFVPPRLLRAAKYGGLNVHPSLLPDLRGPAPLHHALLLGRTHTGTSLQTLSEKTFDAGAVLAQTPLPGIPIPEPCTLAELHALLTPPSAAMLVDGLRANLHVPPHINTGWSPTLSGSTQLDHAPKVNSKDKQIRWATSTAASVVRQANILGPLSAEISCLPGNAHGDPHQKHIILEDLSATTKVPSVLGTNSTCFSVLFDMERVRVPYITDEDGQAVWMCMPAGGYLRIASIKVQGKRSQPAVAALRPFAEAHS